MVLTFLFAAIINTNSKNPLLFFLTLPFDCGRLSSKINPTMKAKIYQLANGPILKEAGYERLVITWGLFCAVSVKVDSAVSIVP
jgi:hypothetical protein